MVGLVIVSHSARLAEGVVELAREMGGDEVPIEAAGGLDDPEGAIGTDAMRVMAAIERADAAGDGALVLMDLGSAVLSAETALDFLPDDQRERVLLCEAPLVEGAVAAAAAARAGGSLAEVAEEARLGLAGKQAHLGGPDAAEAGARGVRRSGDWLSVDGDRGRRARPPRAARRRRGAHRRGPRRRGAPGEHDHGPGARPRTQPDGPLHPGGAARPRGADPRPRPRRAGRPRGGGGHRERAGGRRGPAGARRARGARAGRRGRPRPRATSCTARRPRRVAPRARRARRGGAPRPCPRSPPGRPGEERAALRAALEAVGAELRAARDAGAGRAGTETAEILDAQAMLLDDEELVGAAEGAIAGGRSAAAAWDGAVRSAAEGYEGLDDEYLRARAGDLLRRGPARARPARGRRSVGAGGARHPGGRRAGRRRGRRASTRRIVAGIATAGGGPTSHASIIARTLGVPAVAGLGAGVLEIGDGVPLLLDGDAGLLRGRPRRRDRRALRAPRAARTSGARPRRASGPTSRRSRATAGTWRWPRTSGRRTTRPRPWRAGADGVGLLRTEFLFLDRATAPDEEEQLRAYGEIGALMEGRRTVLRTLDAGADKPLRLRAARPRGEPVPRRARRAAVAGAPRAARDPAARGAARGRREPRCR